MLSRLIPGKLVQVLVVALAAASLIGVIGLVKDWRAAPGSTQFRSPSYWPWGSAAWFGFRRTTLVGELGIIAITVILAFPAAALVLGAVTFGALVPLTVTIYLFNAPKILVPPALRADEGVFTQSRRGRAS